MRHPFGYRLKKISSAFLRKEDGTTMVEFAIVISLFLLILFAILDFARLGYAWVSTEKVVQIAARTAAVRYPICANVPQFHGRARGGPELFPPGTSCRTDGGICIQTDPQVCTLQDGLNLLDTDTEDAPFRRQAAEQIRDRIQALLPGNVTPQNIEFSYAYDKNLGFIGGPYVPLITVQVIGSGDTTCGEGEGAGQVCFTFVTPLSALAANAGSAATGVPNKGGTIPFPAISATVPGEDLNFGMEG